MTDASITCILEALKSIKFPCCTEIMYKFLNYAKAVLHRKGCLEAQSKRISSDGAHTELYTACPRRLSSLQVLGYPFRDHRLDQIVINNVPASWRPTTLSIGFEPGGVTAWLKCNGIPNGILVKFNSRGYVRLVRSCLSTYFTKTLSDIVPWD
ncbi:hypothetical protein BJ165DRAFT_1545655 [Panaeolus papilionaceus]|nr:hypothetical protein BJ165DRAFT_1545655 [Panaeolus papilionaceus]